MAIDLASAAPGAQHDVVDVARCRDGPGRAETLLVKLDVPSRFADERSLFGHPQAETLSAR